MTSTMKLLFAMILASLALAPTAQAAAPRLLSVGQQDRHATANFSAPGADDGYISIASSPDRATDGSFLSENLTDFDIFTDSEIANGYWLNSDQLDAGTYYVMLDANTYDESACGSNCTNGYFQRHDAKVRFNRVGWFAGDVYWAGRMTIWYTRPGSKTVWHYAYTIKRVNDYCKSVLHKKNCTKTYRVR
jgi:hypothetical protein